MHVPLAAARRVVRHVVRPVLAPRLSAAKQRVVLDALMRLPVLPKGTQIDPMTLGGVPGEQIITPATDPQRALLFLHGGAYLVGSPRMYRAAVAHLTHAVGAVAHVLDYRLAPEHPYPAAVDDALAAYRDLLGRGFTPDRIVVAGDSAGGGLALALAQRARTVELPAPAAIGLISPWVDLSLDGLDETIDDPLLTRAWLEMGAAAYAGTDRGRPEVSPIRADLTGLPPLFVHGASDEMFLPDIERFVQAARAAGVEVTHRRLEGHWHDTHLFAGMVREATEVCQQMGSWLRGAMDAAGSARRG